MCTVTYIPKGAGKFRLTSNRDESPQRAAKGILHHNGLLFPRDSEAGGTWIATSALGRAAVLLNGAFSLHIRRPPYRLSRGLMLLQFFEFNHVEDFKKNFDFKGLEPFTLIVWDQNALHELRWDENRLYYTKLNPEEPRVWASATLYNPENLQKRQNWFQQWLQEIPRPSDQEIMHWHRHAGEGDPWNDLVMNRHEMVKTVSITGISFEDREIQMFFQDLLHGDSHHEILKRIAP
jgi:uncharacterized protein with NRDE domain